MAFIRNKKIGKKEYAYEIKSYWDTEKKKPRQKSKYLGAIGKSGEIIKKVSRAIQQEKLILDFGDSYFLYEFIKRTNIFSLLGKINLEEVFPLIIYKLCNQSAMRNCSLWMEGNYASNLFSNCDLSSQNISRVLKKLGEEDLQRDFFTEYLRLFKNSESIIIDATSLPNQINSSFTQWGRNDGGIDKQFRFLCVMDQSTKAPLFYRFLPGNIVDVSTLQQTIKELELIGVKKGFVLLDAGYFSEENIKALYELKIDFMSRLPAGRILYKDLINNSSKDLESASNFVKHYDRGLFIKSVDIDLFGSTGHAYIVLDPIRKGKEVAELISSSESNIDLGEINTILSGCGIMILVSSKKIDINLVLSSYYSRQSIEQIFGFFKDDLDSLPIRCHSDATIKGYLFLQFIALIIFTQLRLKLPNKFSVEQALLILKSLKAKVFDTEILIAEKNKNVKTIFQAFDYLVPNSLGI